VGAYFMQNGFPFGIEKIKICIQDILVRLQTPFPHHQPEQRNYVLYNEAQNILIFSLSIWQ
jgi:hypothetical protein